MPNFRQQFEQALTNIEVNGQKRERAIEAHTEIRELLQQDEQLKEWGVEPILIGSYSRRPAYIRARTWTSFSASPTLIRRQSPRRRLMPSGG